MKVLFALGLFAIMLQTSTAVDPGSLPLRNNKESYSRLLRKDDLSTVAAWKKNHELSETKLNKSAVDALYGALTEFLKRETQCDLGFPSMLAKHAVRAKIIRNASEMGLYLNLLRVTDQIDDIFLKLLRDSIIINDALSKSASITYPSRPFNLHTRWNEDVDLEKMYSILKVWPDDVEYCTLGRYFRLVSTIKFDSSKDRNGQMKRLDYLALEKNVIELATYNKLRVLRENDVLDWPTTMNTYLEVIRNAKDKLAKDIEKRSKNSFNETFYDRREKLTRRGRLYKEFNSTQIMIMAQLIEKTAKRMDARYVNLNFQFTDDPAGETEIYVLSPMEQYRASIKLLRKDFGEILRSDNFRGTGVEYEDLISAAFETGFLKSNELDAVIKFEEFWNPTQPRWKTYANWAFSLGSTASFFLPTPLNILGAVGLIVTQSKLMNKPKADPDDNWNAII